MFEWLIRETGLCSPGATSGGNAVPHSRTMTWLALLLGLAALGGCTSTRELGGDPGLLVFPASKFPAPDRSDLTTAARPYFVGPFDSLSIDVFGIPELSKRDVQVDEAGQISFPPAGMIDVAGKTTAEIQELMAQRLRANFIRNPQVTVNLKDAKSQVITIEGEVKSPGIYPVLGSTSLLRSMAMAKGVSEFAKLDDVVIFRTVSGQRYAALYNLKEVRRGNVPDPELYANDVVVVGDSTSRRFFKDFLQAVPAITGPLFFAIDRAVN